MSETVSTQTQGSLWQSLTNSIGQRLLLTFFIVGVLSVIISFVGWFALAQQEQATNRIVDKEVPTITAILTLSKEASSLVSLIPQLQQARTVDDREKAQTALQRVLLQASEQLDFLTETSDQSGVFAKAQTHFVEFSQLVNRLNTTVKALIGKEEIKRQLRQKSLALRADIISNVSPLESEIDVYVMDNVDGWFTLLDERLTTVQEGGEADLDVTDMEEQTYEMSSFQSAVQKFIGNGYYLASLLQQGSQGETIETVDALAKQFFIAHSAMAEPLDNLGEGQAQTELFRVFDELFVIGKTGDENTNIFELRKAQIAKEEESRLIFTEATSLAEMVTEEVDRLVIESKNQTAMLAKISQQEAEQAKWILVVVTAVSIILMALIAVLYVRRNLLRRLSLLGDAMQSIAQGNLKTSVYRNGKDEISLMGHALMVLRNGLRDAEVLKQQQESMQQKMASEKQQNQMRLADNFDVAVGQSLSVLSDHLGAIRRKTNQMNDIAVKSKEDTKEVAQASDVMSQDVNSVAESAAELSKSIQEISRQVDQSTKIAENAVSRAETLNGNIAALEKASEQIKTVVDLISAIADQTNMLALNATIEASRAGEAGKGFAVVASEVKNLANQTTGAISQISQLVNSIEGEITQAVEANQQISYVITEINDVSTGIAAAVNQQSSATARISETVKTSATHVDEISARVLKVSEDMEEAGLLIGDVLGGVSTVNDQSQSLMSDVDGFVASIREGT